jgi:hypothetical protein
MADPDSFRRCSTCRTPIAFGATYFTCSVSTCNRPRIGLFFCSVPCFEAHVPEARHRDAWAEEQQAPTRQAWEAERARAEAPAAAAPRGRIVAPRAATAPTELEVLVVVSKLKQYVRDRSGMNTSDGVVGVLSEHLRALCHEAIRSAAADGRKTVLDRDFPRPKL